MWNVQAGLLSVSVINAVYNLIAEFVGKGQRGIDPIVFSTYRDAAAAPILYCLALSKSKDLLYPQTREDVWRIALQGFLGIYLNQILFLVGVQLTNGTVGSICNLTLPVFAKVIGVCTGKEKFKWATAWGLCLCIFGALIMKIESEGSHHSGEKASVGICILILGSFSSALYYIIQKKSLTKYSAVFVTSWEYIFGFLFMALSAVIFSDYDPERWRLNKVGALALAFTVVFNSVAKYLLNSICNKYVSATVLTAWSTVVPVFTAVLAFMFLKTPFQLSYLGSLPVLLGISLVMKARGEEEQNSYKTLINFQEDPY